jgi:hypothetical protein
MYFRQFWLGLLVVLAGCQGGDTAPPKDEISKKADTNIAPEPKSIVQRTPIAKHLLTGQGLKDVLLGGSFSNRRSEPHGFTWKFKASGECTLAGGDGSGIQTMRCEIKNDQFCTDKKIEKLVLDQFGRVVDIDRSGRVIGDQKIIYDDCKKVFHIDENRFSFEDVYSEGTATYEYQSY